MKTRIISGIILGAVIAGIITLGMLVSHIFIIAVLGIISAIAVYELLCNVAKIESKLSLYGAVVYSFLACFCMAENITYYVILSIAYSLFAVIVTLKNHKDFDLAKILVSLSMPMVLSFAFSCFGLVINNSKGLYYLLLLFNFACVCDMGAYFVGVTMGKHKLCPEISPKKTVEGAIGGILVSVIVSLIIVLCFSATEKIVITLLLTIPLCIVGMMGDLFASAIKRSVGLKDYGNLIPGHGGILDRFDSMLLIAPVLVALITVGVI